MAKSVKKKTAKPAVKAKKVAKTPTKKVVAKAKPAKSSKKTAPKVAAKPAKKEKQVKPTAKKEAKVVTNTSEVRTSKPAAPPLKLSPSQLNIFPILNQQIGRAHV